VKLASTGVRGGDVRLGLWIAQVTRPSVQLPLAGCMDSARALTVVVLANTITTSDARCIRCDNCYMM
jgi:hypothetical protein